MVDFEEYFLRGIEGAKRVESDKTEVASVIDEFATDLLRASGGRATVELKRKSDLLFGRNNLINLLAGEDYNSLAVVHTTADDFSPIVVAGWKQSESGYPCTITFNKQENACFDAESLRAALSELAASEKMGAAVLTAINYGLVQSPGLP